MTSPCWASFQMGRFSLGMAAPVSALSLVILVIVTALVRGPYAGADPQRRTASRAPAEIAAPLSPSMAPKSATPLLGSARPAVSVAVSVVQTSGAEVPSAGADIRQAIVDLDAKRRVGDVRGQLALLERLADLDVAVFGDADLQTKLVTLSQQVTLLPGNEPERLFSLLSTKTGTHGPDMLLHLVTNRGGSTASKLAAKLLEDPEVVARGSEAMQIAYLLRVASCDEKKSLFARGGAKGDRRTRGQLEQLSRDCSRSRRRPSGCCFGKDPHLLAALAALDARNVK